MIEIAYTPSFLRQFKKLELALQEEAYDKIAAFQKNPRESRLKTHKLKGKLKGRWSFSVNYQARIVFQFLSKKEVAFLAIGDHDVYKQ